MKDSLRLGFWVANIIVNNGIGDSILSKYRQVSTQQEAIDEGPCVVHLKSAEQQREK